MDLEAPGEGIDGGEPALLKTHADQAGGGLLAFGGVGVGGFAQGAVAVEEAGELEFGGVVGQVVEGDAQDVALGEAAVGLVDVFLEATHHDLVQGAGADGGAAGELAVDAAAAAGGGGGVVGFVQDQEVAGAVLVEPLGQGAGVGLVDQQAVADQEAAVGAPGIDVEAALAADLGEVGAVEDHKQEPETLIQLCLPLLEHLGRCGTTMRLTLLRKSSSRAIKPASMVLPRPV